MSSTSQQSRIGSPSLCPRTASGGCARTSREEYVAWVRHHGAGRFLIGRPTRSSPFFYRETLVTPKRDPETSLCTMFAETK